MVTYTKEEIEDSLPECETIENIIEAYIEVVDGVAMWNGIPATPRTVIDEAIDSLVFTITTWKPSTEKIEVLKGYLDDLEVIVNAIERKIDDFVDLSDLPSEPIPSELTSWPIWAMDFRGYCLTGNLDEIEHIETIKQLRTA